MPNIGDRYVGSNPDDVATVIKVTGQNTAILRFDSDAAFNKRNGLSASKADLEFDLTHFKPVTG